MPCGATPGRVCGAGAVADRRDGQGAKTTRKHRDGILAVIRLKLSNARPEAPTWLV